MLFSGDERSARLLAAAFLVTVGAAIGLATYHANGAELDGAWLGQSVLVVLAFTFAMRTSQDFREHRARKREQARRANSDDRTV